MTRQDYKLVVGQQEDNSPMPSWLTDEKPFYLEGQHPGDSDPAGTLHTADCTVFYAEDCTTRIYLTPAGSTFIKRELHPYREISALNALHILASAKPNRTTQRLAETRTTTPIQERELLNPHNRFIASTIENMLSHAQRYTGGDDFMRSGAQNILITALLEILKLSHENMPGHPEQPLSWYAAQELIKRVAAAMRDLENKAAIHETASQKAEQTFLAITENLLAAVRTVNEQPDTGEY